MANEIKICGAVGACGGAIGGFLIGGMPGALVGGQVGAGLGLNIGGWVAGGKLVEKVTDDVLKKALDITDRATKYLTAGAITSGTFCVLSHYTQQECDSSSEDHFCNARKWVNTAALVATYASAFYLSAKAIQPVDLPPPLETKKGSATMEEEKPTGVKRLKKAFDQFKQVSVEVVAVSVESGNYVVGASTRASDACTGLFKKKD